MANVNTINSQVSGSIQNTFAALANPTSTTAFSLNSSITGIGGGIIPLGPEPGVMLAGRPFRLRAWGTVTGGTTTNFTLGLYQVPYSVAFPGPVPSALTGTNALANSGAKAVNSSTTQFYAEATLFYDTVSAVLNGSARFQVGASFVAESNITAVTGLTAPTAINSAAALDGSANLLFLVTGVFSASNAGNVANLNEFAIEQL